MMSCETTNVKALDKDKPFSAQELFGKLKRKKNILSWQWHVESSIQCQSGCMAGYLQKDFFSIKCRGNEN